MNDNQANALGLDLAAQRGHDGGLSLDDELLVGRLDGKVLNVYAKERHIATVDVDGNIVEDGDDGSERYVKRHGRIIVARGRRKPHRPVGEDRL